MIDHSQMQALKDPRIDGSKDESDERLTAEPQQQDLGFAQTEAPKQLEQSDPTEKDEGDD